MLDGISCPSHLGRIELSGLHELWVERILNERVYVGLPDHELTSSCPVEGASMPQCKLIYVVHVVYI